MVFFDFCPISYEISVGNADVSAFIRDISTSHELREVRLHEVSSWLLTQALIPPWCKQVFFLPPSAGSNRLYPTESVTFRLHLKEVLIQRIKDSNLVYYRLVTWEEQWIKSASILTVLLSNWYTESFKYASCCNYQQGSVCVFCMLTSSSYSEMINLYLLKRSIL